jgi:hypothetical protein
VSLYLTAKVPGDPERLTPIGQDQAAGASASFELEDAPTGRYLTVWLTSLPQVAGGYKGGITELVVSGS